MLPVYDQFFQSQLQRARGPDGFVDPNLAALIPENWRSDAQVFLLSNILTMVVAPFMSASPSGALLETSLWSPLREDVATIVERAEAVSRDRERGYVSATSVAIAVGQLAPELLTTGLQIWGPRSAPPPPPTHVP
jgi:hypothetical protein